jgi:hypothetical protein
MIKTIRLSSRTSAFHSFSFYAAMVADLYGANVSQGPALPTSVRSGFVSQLLSNPDLLRRRMIAAIDTVRQSPYATRSYTRYLSEPSPEIA